MFFALAFALMPSSKLQSEGVNQVLAEKARGGDTLFVDGNRDMYGVAFDHARHADSIAGDCAVCHHMNLPQDKQSGCYACHRKMYSSSAAFDHDWHSSPDGANLGCYECHEMGVQRGHGEKVQCNECHKDLIPEKATIAVKAYLAPPYVEAMHTVCIDCHRKQATEGAEYERLPLCTSCHKEYTVDYLTDKAIGVFERPNFNRVVVPGQNIAVEQPKETMYEQEDSDHR
jgi:hypothetical protein